MIPFSELGLLLAAGCGVCLFWGVVGSARAVRQPRYFSPLTPQELGIPFEGLRLEAEDGVPISAWLIRHPKPEGVILLLHGFAAGKADLLDVAQGLNRQGRYHLLMIDFRAHGDSGGKTLSYGSKEVLDVRAGLDYLAQDPDLSSLPIGVYGISMGGAIGIQAVVRYPEIRALVSDSAYADLSKAIVRTQWLTYHIPRIPFAQLVVWGMEIRLKTSIKKLNPVEVIGQLKDQGLFLIHGLKDLSILPGEAQVLFEAAGGRKSLWMVPEAEHVASFYLNKEEYVKRVLSFFDGEFSRT